MKRLIIADVKSHNNHGTSTGHYFALAQNYLDLYQDVCNVKVGGGPIYSTYFKNKDLFLLPYDSKVGEKNIKNKWQVLMNCRYLFQKSTPEDIIVLQMSGALTTYIGIALFAKKWNKIHCIQYSEESLSSPMKRWIYKLAQKKIAGVICPNTRIGKAYERPYCVVTDYIYPYINKQHNNTSFFQKKYDFAIIGSIWPDKGVLEVASKFSNSKYRILIAGKTSDMQYATSLQQIAEKSPNIELKLKFITAQEYYRYILESRYCILNYQGVYTDRSSGVVLDILFNNTPVIGRRCNALQFIEDEQVGYLFDDIQSFDPNIIINETTYTKYQEQIKVYLLKQKEFKKKVVAFLKLSK